jgi:phosphate transport system protein
MTQTHIRSVFDRELETLLAEMKRMGDMVETALLNAADALAGHDEELAQRVRSGDKEIDALEAHIQTQCARLMALRAPTASDLRAVLSIMRIAVALERCGDYAKNLAKRSKLLSDYGNLDKSTLSVSQMTRTVVSRLRQALDSYVARDESKAILIRETDHEIDQMYNSLFRELLTYMLEDPRNIASAMHLQFVGKNMERVGDHATRIAEQTLYLTTGEMPAAERPKTEIQGF